MTRNPSLGFARLGQPRGAAPLVIALGDREHTVDAWLQPLCDDFSLVSLEAPRAADPRRFGVPTRSGDWYLGDEVGPEPSSFGLALIALERFVLHERSSLAGRTDGTQAPILMGVGQGATLCLALARCWAEALAGVIAIDGRLSELPTQAIEERPLLGLPILLDERAGHSEQDRALLVDRGGSVTFARDADPRRIACLLTSWSSTVVRA